MVVGGQGGVDVLPGTVGEEIQGHIVPVCPHISAHLVEGRGRDEVAPAIDLPRDGRVAGADDVGASLSSGGTSVLGDLRTNPKGRVDDHSLEEVWIVVVLIVDDGEDLCLDANLQVGVERIEANNSIVAEDSVVKRGLVLVSSSAGTGGRVGPMDLVGLPDAHIEAVLPVVGSVELGVLLVIQMAQ